MENPILITWLNDFIFCPVSIYFHSLYKEEMFLYVRDVYRVFMKNKQETDMPYWRME